MVSEQNLQLRRHSLSVEDITVVCLSRAARRYCAAEWNVQRFTKRFRSGTLSSVTKSRVVCETTTELSLTKWRRRHATDLPMAAKSREDRKFCFPQGNRCHPSNFELISLKIGAITVETMAKNC